MNNLPDELKDMLLVKAVVAGTHLIFTAPEDLVLKVYNEKGLDEAKKFLDELKSHLLSTIENAGLSNE